jgi:hypothetical protein
VPAGCGSCSLTVTSSCLRPQVMVSALACQESPQFLLIQVQCTGPGLAGTITRTGTAYSMRANADRGYIHMHTL